MKKISLLLAVLFLTAANSSAQDSQVQVLPLSLVSNQIALSKNNNIPAVYEVRSLKEKKSAGLAILYSALLPGMGELYAGDYSIGKYLTIADALFIGTIAGLKYHANNQEDNFKAYAKTNGGVTTDGKDEDYFANIGNYRDIDQYNDEMASQRRFNKMYDVNTHGWKWNTQDERKAYRDLWVSRETANNNVRFVVGAMILNRVASIVNAVRLVASHNKSIDENATAVYFGYEVIQGVTTNLTINLRTGF
ncbi:MAG: hypothetical protein HUU43_08425 [Ignavibacteriaceae bacterium]|nr:hypothetical protein [Ignavibacteriaceae bacterium]NUM70861.1 hypothetical protein [Ignavibacteriaceae bacterium]